MNANLLFSFCNTDFQCLKSANKFRFQAPHLISLQHLGLSMILVVSEDKSVLNIPSDLINCAIVSRNLSLFWGFRHWIFRRVYRSIRSHMFDALNGENVRKYCTSVLATFVLLHPIGNTVNTFWNHTWISLESTADTLSYSSFIL